ncbi:MAG: TonB-dependent receptor [Sphingopyxis sp.]
MKRSKRILYSVGMTAAVMATAFTDPALAQDAGGDIGGEDIVVTAQRRGESIQDIPIAVTALSGDELSERNYRGLADLDGVAPSLNISTYAATTRINIRGIGNTNTSPGSDGSVALYKNGVYVARSVEGGAGFFDMERIEVLRGPQGDLYGRNATGGAISIISRRPGDTLGGHVELGFGNYDQRRLEAAIDLPLASTLRTRIAVAGEKRDGYGTNLATGTDVDDANNRAIRATLVFEPSSDFEVTLIGEYYRSRDRAGPFSYFGNTNPGLLPGQTVGGGVAPPTRLEGNLLVAIDPRNISNEQDPFSRQTVYAATGSIVWRVAPGIELNSITGFRDTSYFFKSELDATTALYRTDIPDLNGFVQIEDSQQFSQELLLIGDGSGLFSQDDRFEWLLGASYFQEDVLSYASIGLAPNPPVFGIRAGGDQDITSYAVFGRFTWRPTPKLGITAGLRYSHEKRDAVEFGDRILSGVPEGTLVFPPLCGGLCAKADSDSSSALTPRFVLEYQPTDDLLLYAQATRGFRSGGFSMGQFAPAYDPEFVWSYEAGAKFTTADRSFRLNLAAFQYQYDNLQISTTRAGFIRTSNAADSKVRGVEAEAVLAPHRDLSFDIGYTYLDARFKELVETDNITGGLVDLSGNRLPNTAKHSVSVGANWGIDAGFGTITLRGELRYKDDVFLDFYNRDVQEQKGYALVNASVRLASRDDRWSVDIFGRNLTDKTIATTIFLSTGSGFPRNGLLAPPRTFGVRFRVNFD